MESIDSWITHTEWKYLGLLNKNNQQIIIPDNAIEVNFLQIDSYINETNYRAATSIIIPSNINGFAARILFDAQSISPHIKYDNRVITMIDKFDNNATKVWYR